MQSEKYKQEHVNIKYCIPNIYGISQTFGWRCFLNVCEISLPNNYLHTHTHICILLMFGKCRFVMFANIIQMFD